MFIMGWNVILKLNTNTFTHYIKFLDFISFLIHFMTKILLPSVLILTNELLIELNLIRLFNVLHFTLIL